MTDMALIPYGDYQAAANQVRTLGGTPAAIKSGELPGLLEAANTEVTTQTSLINELIEQANSLPEAGGSGGTMLNANTLTAIEALETAAGEKAKTIENGIEVGRPYLHSYGYLQCVAECTDDNTQPVELYEWIYQRLYIGDRVSNVRVEGAFYSAVYTSSDNVDYLRIPVMQFKGITVDNYWDSTYGGNDTLIRYYLRVVYDNPELLGVTSWLVLHDGINITHFCIPLFTHGEQAEMLAACQASAAQVDAKIQELYQIAPGDSLTHDQKRRVSKVIHDWLVLHSQYDTVNAEEELDQTMYPALSGGANDPVCAGYALAYQWLARRYGIESVGVTGFVHSGGTESDGSFSRGRHIWNLVNLRETDGVYTESDSKWTLVDCTWDDPTGTSNVNYIRWDYFQIPWSEIPKTPGTHGYRELDHWAYAYYPTEAPADDERYTGSTPYTWEEG